VAAWLGATLVLAATTAFASTSAPMAVGVTVVRSCAVSVSPETANTSVLRLNCVAGTLPVQIGERPQGPRAASRSARFRVETQPARQPGYAVASVNF
jgi:hypothetical protein